MAPFFRRIDSSQANGCNDVYIWELIYFKKSAASQVKLSLSDNLEDEVKISCKNSLPLHFIEGKG